MFTRIGQTISVFRLLSLLMRPVSLLNRLYNHVIRRYFCHFCRMASSQTSDTLLAICYNSSQSKSGEIMLSKSHLCDKKKRKTQLSSLKTMLIQFVAVCRVFLIYNPGNYNVRRDYRISDIFRFEPLTIRRREHFDSLPPLPPSRHLEVNDVTCTDWNEL